MLRQSVIFIGIISLVAGADHAMFRTCAQTDFCTRLRTVAGSPKFQLSTPVVNAGQDTVTATLTNTATSEILSFSISAVQGGIFRLIVDEVASARYRLDKVLDGVPLLARFDVVTTDAQFISVTVGTNKATVYINPFKIEFYENGALTSLINGGGRLNFELGTLTTAFSFDVSFINTQIVYGIPEHCEQLALRTTAPGAMDPYRLYNLDVSDYELASPMALYGSIPVLYAHGTAHTTGIFLHNAAEMWFEITNGSPDVGAYVMTESGVLDLFVLMGPTPRETVQQYATLTGVAPLPQYFTLAHHQSRWSYVNEEDVQTVVANFDLNDFPLDVMWLDIGYTDGKKYFTWDPINFPTPLNMQANLTATNRKVVAISDPHFKVETGYFVYDEALANDHFVKNEDGSIFQGVCWPGLSSYIDYFKPAALDFYSGLFAFDRFVGSTENLYIWNDMNEPSVFNDTVEKTFTKFAKHNGNIAHRDVHNAYGLYQTIGTHQGLLNRAANPKRPFVLTRSHFAGSQRFTAVWTGDNTADWGYLASSVPMCLGASLSGISFCGADVGGFTGNPDVELLQRWYQVAAWMPFYRAHSSEMSDRREPYLFASDVQARIRVALKKRYANLPLWYTLFWEHTQTKEPIMRPLFYEYPTDPQVASIDNHFLVGANILVYAVTTAGATSAQVYLPGGPSTYWFELDANLFYIANGFANVVFTLDRIPVFYKGGSIVPRKDIPRSSSDLMKDDPFTMYVFLDSNQQATGTLYIDDGVSFNYRNKEYLYVRLQYGGDVFSFSPIDDGQYPGANLTVDQVMVFRPPVKGIASNSPFEVKTYDVNINLKLKPNEVFSIKL